MLWTSQWIGWLVIVIIRQVLQCYCSSMCTTDFILQTEGFYDDVGLNYVRHEFCEDKSVARKIDDRRQLHGVSSFF